MKLKLFVVFAVIFALIVEGCTAPAPDYNMQPNEPSATSGKPEEPPEQPDAPEEPPTDLSRLKPLELLGYFIDENGDVWTDSSDWEICDPDVFRQYMFGTWEGLDWFYGELENGLLILDDSEKTFRHNLNTSWNYYRNGDTIIFLSSDYQTGSSILWLDINVPYIMYEGLITGGYNNQFWFPLLGEGFRFPDDSVCEIGTLIKTDALINEPENGYMSRLRLHEIMRDYDIDFDTIFLIENEFYVGE
ncbi:MAG: hypothetical protein LBC82_08925, partial [Oscillospiraceae bacterium]|nr:hypothetical protein [Oscillospiraceae bacterium]